MTQSPGSLFIYFVIPMTGLLTDMYLLYRTFFLELWNQGWATGQSVVVFDLICCAGALILALRYKSGTTNACKIDGFGENA